MQYSKIDIDRSVNSLRVSSNEFVKIKNSELIKMFEECIQNIKEIAYYWATTASDNKRVTNTTAEGCLLYTSPSPRDATLSRMPASA